MAQPVRPPLERFMEKEALDLETGCWLWQGTIDPVLGYGRFWMGKDHHPPAISAHTAAWLLLRGPMPEGREPDHLCRRRPCVNPDHLEPVTHQENTRRGQGFIGERSRQTHCTYGHLFDEKNTYHQKNGTRRCRRCAVRHLQEHRRRARART